MEDRWRHLPGETLKVPASNSHAEIIIFWPPSSADHEQLGFGVAMRSSPTNLLLQNTFSLPARTRHPSLAWNKPPAETRQSGLFVSLSGSCSGFLVRVIANQHSSSAGQSCHYPWNVADETLCDTPVRPHCQTIVKQHNHTAGTKLCSVCLCWVKSPNFLLPSIRPLTYSSHEVTVCLLLSLDRAPAPIRANKYVLFLIGISDKNDFQDNQIADVIQAPSSFPPFPPTSWHFPSILYIYI